MSTRVSSSSRRHLNRNSRIIREIEQALRARASTWTEYDKDKIESYMLAIQHIFNPPSTPSLSAPGNVSVDEPIDVGVDEPIDVGVDEPLDVGYTDPPTISEPESGRT